MSNINLRDIEIIRKKYVKRKHSVFGFIILLLTAFIFLFVFINMGQKFLAFIFFIIFIMSSVFVGRGKIQPITQTKENSYTQEVMNYLLAKNNCNNINYLTVPSNKESFIKESKLVNEGAYKIRNYANLKELFGESIDLYAVNDGHNNLKFPNLKLLKYKVPCFCDGEIYIYSNNGIHQSFDKFISSNQEFNKRFNVFQSKIGLANDVLPEEMLKAFLSLKKEFNCPITIRMTGNFMYISLRNIVIANLDYNRVYNDAFFLNSFNSLVVVDRIRKIMNFQDFKYNAESKNSNSEIHPTLDVKYATNFVDSSTSTDEIINILL